LVICHTLPRGLPPGFLAYISAQVLNGLISAYLPLYALCPLPPLYGSGMRYALEPNHGKGWEDFANPWTARQRGWGDCDDLILWRGLELNAQGEHATVNAEWLGNNVHVRIRRPNGLIEDPSILLGAPAPRLW
jgi:hypothetical protein